MKESDYDENGTVTLNEWMAWITQRKQDYDRKKWLLEPWKSFIVIVSLIQFVIGVADRIEKYYRCDDFKSHSLVKCEMNHCLDWKLGHLITIQ